MAFMAALAPYLAAASVAGSAAQGLQKSQADKANADVMAGEARSAEGQAVAQENMVRRNSREALGKEAAAFGGAGVGYGGSSRGALDQSAINQELDALNTRYKGTFTAYGYKTESGILNKQAGQDAAGGVLLAGGQALKSYSAGYFTPGAGTIPPTPSGGMPYAGYSGAFS